MVRRRPNWSDLPQDIVELIINKLHFPDQIRALAVCKNWQVCKDFVTSSDSLPWVVSHRRVFNRNSDKYSFECELFDPYSQEVVTNTVAFCFDDISGSRLYALASNHGWVFLANIYTSLFLHNPFTNEIKSLPMSVDSQNMQATMYGSPTSPWFGIFMLSIREQCYLYLDACYLYLDAYYSNDDDDGDDGVISHEIVEMNGDELFHSMLYMNGNIYALFEDGVLNRYVLEDGSWELLTSGLPKPHESCDDMMDAWLLEIDENLIMVRMDLEGEMLKWMVFRFEWAVTSWVVETGLKSCIIYISGNVAWSAPLTNRNGENLEGCKLFYHNRIDGVVGGRGFKCYSLSEAGGTRMQSNEYDWIEKPGRCDMCFIEPPYFGI